MLRKTPLNLTKQLSEKEVNVRRQYDFELKLIFVFNSYSRLRLNVFVQISFQWKL